MGNHQNACIVREALYEKIRGTAYKYASSYGFQKVEDKNIFVCRHEKDWIANLITIRDVEEMNGQTPCLIASQTGSGKTTFIFKVCLLLAKKEGKKILYLCSRQALKAQIKEAAMKDIVNSYEKAEKCYVCEMKDYYSEKGIEKEHNFGLLDIYSYQEFLHIKDEEFNEYSAAIIDEAHFFLSDAGFNRYTEEILDELLRQMCKTRRIYLTATPEECIRAIYEKECIYMAKKFFCNSRTERHLYVHLVDEDYSYLDPLFFTETDQIVEIIRQDKTDKKWLVFTRTKEHGKKLKTDLGMLACDIDYYDAETDHEQSTSYRVLIREEDLKAKVTIATKIFDVGVNVKTENLNMVLFDDNPVELKQMVGRKRVKKQEHVRVFFHIPDLPEIQKRQGRIKKQIHEEEEIIKRTLNAEYIEPEHPAFVRRKGKSASVEINHLSREKHEQDLYYYQELDNLMNNVADEWEAKILYAKKILELFQLGEIAIEKLLISHKYADNIDGRLKSCMTKWMCRDISKNELEELSKEITDIIGDGRADQRKERNSMGINKLNKALACYGYVIKSVKGKSSVTYKIMAQRGDENV